MNWLAAIWTGVKTVFGVGTGPDGGPGKDLVQETADIYSNYHPGTKDAHDMIVEDAKQQEASQASARVAPQSETHDDWFNRFVDGLNRLPRPIMAFWAIGELTGVIPPPIYLSTMNEWTLNIIWTIVSFYFGIRTVSQDIPTMIQKIRNIKVK